MFDRIGRAAQMILHDQLLRQPFRNLSDHLARLQLPGAQVCLRQPLCQRINRQQPPDVLHIAQLVKLRVRHLSASVVQTDPSEKRHLFSWLKIGFQIFAVKEQQLHIAGIVLDQYFEQPFAAVGTSNHLLCHHTAADQHISADWRSHDRYDLPAILVSSRKKMHQIVHRLDPQLRKQRQTFFADAF